MNRTTVFELLEHDQKTHKLLSPLFCRILYSSTTSSLLILTVCDYRLTVCDYRLTVCDCRLTVCDYRLTVCDYGLGVRDSVPQI